MKIAICEDIIEDFEHLQNLLIDLFYKEKKAKPVIDNYVNGNDFLEGVNKKGKTYDLVFLDIIMPGMNGIEVAKQTSQIFKEMKFVFVTNSRDYAVEAFDIQALHYLVKPVTEEKLVEVLTRYEDAGVKPYLKLKQNSREVTVCQNQICYLQSRNKKTEIVTEHGTFMFSVSMLELEEKLDDNFVRIIRGFIVNMNYILKLENDCCILKDGQTIPLSRRERAKVKKKYQEFLFARLSKIQ